MKYLWLLLPFTLFWAAFYIMGLMAQEGFQWWTIPSLVTLLITFVSSGFYCDSKIDGTGYKDRGEVLFSDSLEFEKKHVS